MKVFGVFTTVFIFLSRLSQAHRAQSLTLSLVLQFERTGNESWLQGVLSSGARAHPSLIQDLATLYVPDHPESIIRRLHLLEALILHGCDTFFPSKTLAACSHVRILELLLARGAASADGDDLVWALVYESFDYADVFLKYGRGQIRLAGLFHLLTFPEFPELSHWRKKNRHHLEIIP